MSILKVYRYHNRVVIPAITRTTDGLLVESEPVQICDVQDPELPALIEIGLGQVPEEQSTTGTDEGPHSVVLEALGLKKWRELEQNALLYTVHRSPSAIEVHVTGRGEDGFWKRDDSLKLTFPPEGTTDELARNLARVILDKKPVEDKPVRLLSGPPGLPPPGDAPSLPPPSK